LYATREPLCRPRDCGGYHAYLLVDLTLLAIWHAPW
jgi:hypothetical protein